MLDINTIIESSEFRKFIPKFIGDFKTLSLESLVNQYEFSKDYSSKNSNYYKDIEGNEDLSLNIRANSLFTEITLKNKKESEEFLVEYQIIKKVSLDNIDFDILVFTKYNLKEEADNKVIKYNKNWSFAYLCNNAEFSYYNFRESIMLKDTDVKEILNNFFLKNVTFDDINDIYILKSDYDLNNDSVAKEFILSLINMNNNFYVRCEKRNKENLVLHNLKVKESIRKLMKG